MKTEDVFVIFNNQSAIILHVYAHEWQATSKYKWYCTQESSTGTLPNDEKLEVCTLKKALTLLEEHVHLHGL